MGCVQMIASRSGIHTRVCTCACTHGGMFEHAIHAYLRADDRDGTAVAGRVLEEVLRDLHTCNAHAIHMRMHMCVFMQGLAASSRRYCATCVVLPEPVSPSTMQAGAASARSSSSRCAAAGSVARFAA